MAEIGYSGEALGWLYSKADAMQDFVKEHAEALASHDGRDVVTVDDMKKAYEEFLR